MIAISVLRYTTFHDGVGVPYGPFFGRCTEFSIGDGQREVVFEPKTHTLTLSFSCHRHARERRERKAGWK